MMDPYEDLAAAVVLQAVKDYRTAREKLRRKDRNKDAKLMIEDCEKFFRSDWFASLTSLDGGMLLKKLKEEEIS